MKKDFITPGLFYTIKLPNPNLIGGFESHGVCLGRDDVENQMLFFQFDKFSASKIEYETLFEILDFENLSVDIPKERFRLVEDHHVIRAYYSFGNQPKLKEDQFKKLISSMVLSKAYDLFNYPSGKIINPNNSNFNQPWYESQMDVYQFLNWTDKKNELIHRNYKTIPKIFNYGIYYAYIGKNIGSEPYKTRPVLIWNKHINHSQFELSSFFVFPISSKINRSNYYFNVPIKLNQRDVIVKINDGRRISIKRLTFPMRDNVKNLPLIVINNDEILRITKAIEKYMLERVEM